MTTTPADRFMRRALELARQGWGQTAPNPMVGAVVVRDGRVVGEGYHARFGEAHAEVAALRAAGDRAKGATLYVSLEPCRHFGKTPPCTDAILAAGIAHVVVGAADPTTVAGGGAALLRERGVQVTMGVLEAEARELNAPFLHAAVSDTPWVTLKLAVSMEGAIGNKDGTASRITSAESRVAVHQLRAGNDAIAVGVGTVLADDPQLTVRDAPPPRLPLKRVVFDRRLRTPPSSFMVRSAQETPTIIVTESPAEKAAKLTRHGVRILPAKGLGEALRGLRAMEIRSLLVEGGAQLASAFLADRLVHRLVIFQAPVSLGPGALHAFDGAATEVLGALEQYPVLERRSYGPDVMTTYALADR